jgi:hypothetical protein
MTDLNSSDVLNRVLARLYRSLMQYAVDCWPWSRATDTAAAETPEQKTIEQMTLRQQEFVARLADLVMRRGGVVDFGSFPDNSELHYVSLDYLLGKLIEDEQNLIAELQTALSALGHDAEATALVSELLAVETQNVSRLRELSRSVAATAAA